MGANQNSSPEFGLCPKINPKNTLFSFDQDSTAIAKLFALVAEHRTVLMRQHERSTTKINSKSSLSPLRHFTEHLVGVFGKLPRENDLDRESSRLSIWGVNGTPEIQPASIKTTSIAIHNQHRAE
jgi:hypothetical protein